MFVAKSIHYKMQSIKDFRKQVEKEDKIKKQFEKKIEKATKEIQSIVDNSTDLDIDSIISSLSEIKELSNFCMQSTTLSVYAKFHSGRSSGIQTAIDLLETIKKNPIKPK